MKYALRPQVNYSKKKAKLLKKFNPRSDKIVIDVGAFDLDKSGIIFANSRRAYRKSLRSEHKFIYYKQKNELVYNENGRKNRVGNGGILAVFKKKIKLKRSHFIFDTTSADADNSPSEPTPSSEKTSTPTPVQQSDSSLKQWTESGEIAFVGEEDIFLLDIPVGHEVFVSAAGDTYPVVDIVNAQGDILVAGEWSRPSSYLKREEPIYARIYGYGGNQGVYTVNFTSDLGGSAKKEAAFVIDKDISLKGSLEIGGGFDYYKLNANAYDVVHFNLISDPELYPLLQIVDQDDAVYSNARSFGSASSDLEVYEFMQSDPQLFLKVTSQSDSVTGDYSIDATFSSRSVLKDEVIRLTNLEREKEGLVPLSYDPLLEIAAQRHVQDMDVTGRYLAHTGSDGSSPGDRIKNAGYKAAWHDNGDGSLMYVSQENAASGQLSASEVVDGWMNSPGHRAAIMAPQAKEIGVGFEVDDRNGDTYWIQNFGIPWSEGDKLYF